MINLVKSIPGFLSFAFNIKLGEISSRNKIIAAIAVATLAVFSLSLICKHFCRAQPIKVVPQTKLPIKLEKKDTPENEKQNADLIPEGVQIVKDPSDISDETKTPSPTTITGHIKCQGTGIGLVGDVEKCRLRLNKNLTLPGGIPLSLEKTDYLFAIQIDNLIGPQDKLKKLERRDFYVPGSIFENCTDKIQLEYKGKIVELSLDLTFWNDREVAKRRCYLDNRRPLLPGCGDLRGFEALKQLGGLASLNLALDEIETAEYRSYEQSKAFKLVENVHVEEVPWKQITWKGELPEVARGSVQVDQDSHPVVILELPNLDIISNVDIILNEEGLHIYARNYEEANVGTNMSRIVFDDPKMLINPKMHAEMKASLITQNYREFVARIPISIIGDSLEQIKNQIPNMKWEYTNGLLILRLS